jgi:hypothetical protein
VHFWANICGGIQLGALRAMHDNGAAWVPAATIGLCRDAFEREE